MMRGYFANGDLDRFSRFDNSFGYNMMNSPYAWVGYVDSCALGDRIHRLGGVHRQVHLEQTW